MSIFDIFRGGANPNAIQKQSGMGDPLNPSNPNLPQNQNQQQTQQTQTPTADPANPQVSNNQQQTQQPPEVDYTKMWDANPAIKPPVDPAAFTFNIQQENVEKMFNQMDFTKTITPELMAKIAGGGQDAISATMAAMNTIAQQAVKTAVMASTKVTENGIQTSGQRMKEFIPSIVRESSVSNALREDNPLMKSPEFAPIVEAVTMQMARQFPNATPDEVRIHTSKYFDRMSNVSAQHSGKQIVDVPTQRATAGQTDWSKEPV